MELKLVATGKSDKIDSNLRVILRVTNRNFDAKRNFISDEDKFLEEQTERGIETQFQKQNIPSVNIPTIGNAYDNRKTSVHSPTVVSVSVNQSQHSPERF